MRSLILSCYSKTDYNFTVNSSDAYGQSNLQLLVRVPCSHFERLSTVDFSALTVTLVRCSICISTQQTILNFYFSAPQESPTDPYPEHSDLHFSTSTSSHIQNTGTCVACRDVYATIRMCDTRTHSTRAEIVVIRRDITSYCLLIWEPRKLACRPSY